MVLCKSKTLFSAFAGLSLFLCCQALNGQSISGNSSVSKSGSKSMPKAPAMTSSPSTPSVPKIPEMNGISGPEMPSISAPSFGGNFYKPAFSKNNSGKTNIQNGGTANESGTTGISGISLDQDSSKNNSLSGNSDANAASDFLSTISGLSDIGGSLEESGFSRLSAKDIQSLGKSGLLNGIYGLNGIDSYLSSKDAVSDLYGNSSSNENEALLKKILNDLDELKKENEKLKASLDKAAETNGKTLTKDLSDSGNSDSDSNSQEENSAAKSIQREKDQNKDFYTTESGRPAILRFSVNGYNLLGTCRTVYFSSKENDGSFLLTADRKYAASNNGVLEETFYLLFRSNGSGGASAGYNVQPAVVQNTENKNSFIYQLAQKKDLTAVKTGNLVSMQCTDDGLKVDLLLDIGKE